MPRTAFLGKDEDPAKSTAVRRAENALQDSLARAGATATISTAKGSATIGAIKPDGFSTINGSDPLGKFFTPPELDFGDEDFLPAGTIETIAEWLIGRRTEFYHLRGARISYFWKKKGGKSGGKVTLGKAQKSSGFTAWVTETDFLMFISADHCRDMAITNFQMEALVYHELCHMAEEEVLDKDGEPTGETRFAIAAHDVTAFHNEVLHYGGWMSDLRQNRNAWEQLAIKEAQNVPAIEEGEPEEGDLGDESGS